jgi:hypothetical protein
MRKLVLLLALAGFAASGTAALAQPYHRHYRYSRHHYHRPPPPPMRHGDRGPR